MRILMLAPQVPWPPRQGTAIRNLNVARQLAARHQLTVVAFGSAAADDPLVTAGARLVTVPAPPPRAFSRRLAELFTDPTPDLARRLASAAMAQAVRSEVRGRGLPAPDVIQIEGLEMAPYGLLTGGKEAAAGLTALTVYDAHNAEWVLQDRAWRTDLHRPTAWHGALYSMVQTAKLRRFERRLLERCQAAVAVSQADAKALAALAPHLPLEVVPNGVDTAFYSAADPALSEPGLCVFTGKMDFRPNIDAMLWFVRSVWPLVRAERHDARLEVVGRDPVARVRALAGNGVLIVGQVDDIRHSLRRASAVVAPLRVGGGTRLKVLEAMAMARPVAATSLAVEGLDLVPEDEVLLGDTPEKLAAQVVRLLGHPRLGRQLGAKARSRAVAHYDWSRLVPRIERLYGAVATADPARGRALAGEAGASWPRLG